MLIAEEGIAPAARLPDITRGEAQADSFFGERGRVDRVVDPPGPVVVPEVVIRIGRIKPNGEDGRMIHDGLRVEQTPSREIWFARGHLPRRTSAGTTGSRHPPWLLQPGWQIGSQCETRSLLMSCVYSLTEETYWKEIALTRLDFRL